MKSNVLQAIPLREAHAVQLVEEWLAEHLISYLIVCAALKVRSIRRLKNLEILRRRKETLLFYLSTAVLTFVAMTHSSPQAERQVTKISVSFSMAALISSPTASSGHLRSSLVSPLSSMMEGSHRPSRSA